MNSDNISAKQTVYFLAQLLLFTGLLGSCVSSSEQEVTLHSSISEDTPYNTAYNAATRKFEVTKNFETRSIITVTHLSPNFLDAINTRSKTLFQRTHSLLPAANQKIGFMVVLYTANRQLNALDNPNFWTVMLKRDAVSQKPASIKKLQPKENFQPFFANINVWTTEYLVLFNNPSANSDEHPNGSTNATLEISNVDTTVEVPL